MPESPIRKLAPLAEAAGGAFAAGGRALRDLYRAAPPVRVTTIDPSTTRDVDHPSDLPER